MGCSMNPCTKARSFPWTRPISRLSAGAAKSRWTFARCIPAPNPNARLTRRPFGLLARISSAQRRYGHDGGCNREGPRQYRRAAWARSQSHTESEARGRRPRKLARFFNESEGFLLFENHGFAVTPRRGNVPRPDLRLPLRRFRHDSAD